MWASNIYKMNQTHSDTTTKAQIKYSKNMSSLSAPGQMHTATSCQQPPEWS